MTQTIDAETTRVIGCNRTLRPYNNRYSKSSSLTVWLTSTACGLARAGR